MISQKEVKHIANLARLGLGEKEIKEMQKELSLILDYFNLLKEVKTKEISLESSSKKENITRADEIKKEDSETIKDLLSTVPQREKGYFKVKSVFEKREN